jgi:hypothetical protein
MSKIVGSLTLHLLARSSESQDIPGPPG